MVYYEAVRQSPMESAVIVVGAGAAGLTAAIAAAQTGSKTTVIEKNASIKSTNTYRAGGMITVAPEKELDPDALRPTAEERAEEALRLSGGHVDPELIKTWHNNILDTVDWLGKVGLKWAEKHPIPTPPGRSKRAQGSGAGLNRQLLEIAERSGCQLLFNTKALSLLTDGMGAVIGVRAGTNDGIADFRAKSVVLAMAGFQANQEMLLKYFGPDFTYNTRLTGSTCATGDGHIMAQEVGAKLVNMNQFHARNIDRSWRPGTSGMWGPFRELWGIIHYCILVNRLGNRFMDETAHSDTIACGITRQPGAVAAIIFDQKIKEIHPAEVDNYRPSGIVMTAPTVKALATKIEIPYPELKKTIDAFNQAVVDGKATGLDVPKKTKALKIETPPFYAIYPVWAGLNCTLGGPKITAQAQVIDRDDKPIPGLYAAGEMVGGFFFGNYNTTKNGAVYYEGNYHATCGALSFTVLFGRIAGANAGRWAAGHFK